jgi:hypothetical protein
MPLAATQPRVRARPGKLLRVAQLPEIFLVRTTTGHRDEEHEEGQAFLVRSVSRIRRFPIDALRRVG